MALIHSVSLTKMSKIIVCFEIITIYCFDSSFSLTIEIDFVADQEKDWLAKFVCKCFNISHIMESRLLVDAVDHDAGVCSVEIKVAHVSILRTTGRIPDVEGKFSRSTVKSDVVGLSV